MRSNASRSFVNLSVLVPFLLCPLSGGLAGGGSPPTEEPKSLTGKVETHANTCENGVLSAVYFELVGDQRLFKADTSLRDTRSLLLRDGMEVRIKFDAREALDGSHRVASMERVRQTPSASEVKTESVTAPSTATR